VSRRDRLVRQALRERFVATLRTGESFDGLLVDVDDKTYRFVDAFALDGTKRMSVDGELFLPRAEVTYLQKPGVSA
jgi:hypothetical protein